MEASGASNGKCRSSRAPRLRRTLRVRRMHNRLRVKGQFIKWLLTLTLKRYYVIHLAVANVRRIYDCHRGEEAPVGRGSDENLFILRASETFREAVSPHKEPRTMRATGSVNIECESFHGVGMCLLRDRWNALKCTSFAHYRANKKQIKIGRNTNIIVFFNLAGGKFDYGRHEPRKISTHLLPYKLKPPF